MIKAVLFCKRARLCPHVFFGFAKVGHGKKGKSELVCDIRTDGPDDILVFIRTRG